MKTKLGVTSKPTEEREWEQGNLLAFRFLVYSPLFSMVLSLFIVNGVA
jgi:hypothetical protein